MNALEVPFNKYVGLQIADTEDDYILKLVQREEYLNHLGTLHASLLFTLAEATSGEFLFRKFKDYDMDVIPVVRKVEIKYRKPGNGTVFSKADFLDTDTEKVIAELNSKKRVIIKVSVDIYNDQDDKLVSSVIDWFITMN